MLAAGSKLQKRLHNCDRPFNDTNGLLFETFESHDGTNGGQQVLLPQSYRLKLTDGFMTRRLPPTSGSVKH